MAAPSRALIDLLGARWCMGAPVVGAAWDGAGDVAGFGLGDGTVALAQRSWRGGPRLEDREGQGVALHPAQQPPPPVSRVSVHGGTCLGLTSDGEGGFLSGGNDGRLARTSRDGTVQEVARFPGKWADPVAAGSGGWRACACGRQVSIFGEFSLRLNVTASVTALAFDPRGRTLAIAHEGGVTLWTAWVEGTRLLPHGGSPRALAWSPDGKYVVAGTQENALRGWRIEDGAEVDLADYPSQPLSLSFSEPGRFLATSGAPRVVCWPFNPPLAGAAHRECGIASNVAVTKVACHPSRTVVAAAYQNGAVLLCQPGVDDSLFVRAPSGTPVTALAWSQDGMALATGTEDGEIGVVSLPDRLFRQPATREENA